MIRILPEVLIRKLLIPTAMDGSCNFTSGGVGSLVSNLTLIPKNSTQALIDAVLRVGPISVAINAGGDFMSYSSGIYNPPDCDPTQLDHAVTVVGFGENEKGQRYFHCEE